MALADKIEQAWKEFLPNINRTYHLEHYNDVEYADDTGKDFLKELVFLNKIQEEEYTVAYHYILSKKERWIKEIGDFFSAFVPRKVEGLWPQLVSGFTRPYIQRCLVDPDGKEKFAGALFEALFDRLMCEGDDYVDKELQEMQSYILDNKSRWLPEAKAYHKL